MKDGVAEKWDEPELIDAVAKDLAAMTDDGEDVTLETKPTSGQADDTPAADDQSTPEGKDEPAEEPKAGDPPADAKSATPAKDGEELAGAAGSDDPPAIPDSHYRAAIHMGMTPEEVSDLYDKDPKLALKTFAKCHEMTNAASRQLGELGQAVRRAREAATPLTPSAAPAGESKREKAVKAIREKYADDPMVDVLLELLPSDTPTPPAKPQAPAAPQQRSVDEEIAVRQQISTFFADPDLEAYSEFYGPAKGADGSAVSTWEHLTPGQRANRLAMLGRAQLILDGAEATGMKLSAAEAMERAHLEVSAPIAQQIVREKIKTAVVKRAKGVTIKPSAGKAPLPKAGKYNEQEHVADVAAELKSIFGS